MGVGQGDENRDTGTAGRTTETGRSVWRLVLSISVAALLTAAVWALVPDQLSVRTDVVSSLIFNDVDVVRYDYAYYCIAFLFPLAAIGLYCFLARWGPLRYRGGDRSAVLPLRTVPEPGGVTTRRLQGGSGVVASSASASPPSVRTPVPPDTGSDQWPEEITVIGALGAVARVALPAATIVLGLAVARSLNLRDGWPVGLLAASTYVVAVVLVAFGFRAWPKRPSQPDGGLSSTFPASLSRANSLLAIAVVPLLYPISQSTSVGIGSPAHRVHYPWLPWWLVGLVTLACLFAWLHADRKPDDRHRLLALESGTLTWLVGPVLLYLVVASFPGALGAFQAFDDAHFLAGPQLVFQHRLFPWRDIYLLHGVLADLFDGKIGMVVFGNTRWGANAGLDLIVGPINWLGLYFFSAYFCRKNRLLLVGLAIAIACGLVQGNSARFLLLPIFLITFDAVLRQPTWRRCWLFMSILVVGAVVSPEQALFAPCLLLTLVVSEAAARSHGQPISTSFRRTGRCVVAGGILSVAWLTFLAATGSLPAFFDYFRVFASGYGLEGRVPTQWDLTTQLMVTFAWVIPVVLWLATVGRVAMRLRLRQVWTTADWVTVAAAAVSAIYYPQALARADIGHVYESFWVSVPLLILWSVEVLSVADRAARSILLNLSVKGSPVRVFGILQARRVATFAAVLAIIAATTGQVRTISAALGAAPANFHPTVAAGALSVVPRLGYTVPGAVDTVQIHELQAVLDRYAGKSAPVFDYSNEPGIVYYLLNRTGGTRYSHVDEVQTRAAQQEVISELQASRPPVVIFSNKTFGLLSYDGIPQALRSYAVSTYLYRHYQPLLDASGQLLLLRNDLFAAAPPVPPGFGTRQLYFDTQTCRFGDIPNFFQLPADIARRPRVRVPLTRGATNLSTTVTGWAVDRAAKAPATRILAVADGRVVAASTPSLPRSDVAEVLHAPSALESGFTITIPVPDSEKPELFAVDAAGGVSPLTPAPGPESRVLGTTVATTVVTPDGKVHPVVGGAVLSNIDAATRTTSTLVTLHLPSHVTPTSYYWLELSSSAPLGTSSFALTDQLAAPPGHVIEFNTLPRVGSRVYVGAGSCLQWQGYKGARDLYLQSSGSPPPHLSVALVK